MNHFLEIEKKINSSPEEVYKALTEPEILSIWFTRNAKADLRAGGRYSNDDRDEGEFLELVPGKKIRFTWENKKHCPGTEVIMDIEGTDGSSLVNLRHEKLDSEEGVKDMMTGWQWAMESLKSYLETGKHITFEEWQKVN